MFLKNIAKNVIIITFSVEREKFLEEEKNNDDDDDDITVKIPFGGEKMKITAVWQ